jgi:cytochrome c oxidase subunit 2
VLPGFKPQQIYMLKNFFFNQLFCDSPEAWQIYIQDPASSALEGMIYFHNYLMFFLLIIGIAVVWFLLEIIRHFTFNKDKKPSLFTHSNVLEIVWTVVPSFVLLLIAVPSFSLLYSLDDLIDPFLTLKIVGHQWYWSYEISDPLHLDSAVFRQGVTIDSYLKSTSELQKGSYRLLETDRRLVLPVESHIRLMVSSTDVLHSATVPSFGFKVDACPGRVSEASLFIKRTGTFYGQCSEICGVNHGFMPIVVEAVTKKEFLAWYASKIEAGASTPILNSPDLPKEAYLITAFCVVIFYTFLVQYINSW